MNSIDIPAQFVEELLTLCAEKEISLEELVECAITKSLERSGQDEC